MTQENFWGRYMPLKYIGRYSEYRSEQMAFRNALIRCTNPARPEYADYGGRGIKFKFRSFHQFFQHIGPKPSPAHTLDRIDNNGHYEIGNVRWATVSEQLVNRRRMGRRPKRDILLGLAC